MSQAAPSPLTALSPLDGRYAGRMATLRSTLPAEEVAKEKDVILREIDMCLDDPDQRLGQALFETAFRAHPYRQPIIGHRDVFAATTREDLLDEAETVVDLLAADAARRPLRCAGVIEPVRRRVVRRAW